MEPQLFSIRTRKLCYTLARQELIHDLDLTLSSSGITVIMGPNGAGKSILLRLLNGLIEPSSGLITVNDSPLSHAVRQSQAMVFQKPILLRRTVIKNIEFILKLRHVVPAAQFCEDILKRIGLLDRRHQPARSLSGGEQQRLALGKALATRPATLFLDEPTASSDPHSTSIIERILRSESDEGVKIILVTHDQNQARRLADDIVFLNHGRIVENSLAEQFFARPKSTLSQSYLAGELIT